jgi:hypothetical protein
VEENDPDSRQVMPLHRLQLFSGLTRLTCLGEARATSVENIPLLFLAAFGLRRSNAAETNP